MVVINYKLYSIVAFRRTVLEMVASSDVIVALIWGPTRCTLKVEYACTSIIHPGDPDGCTTGKFYLKRVNID